MTVNKKLTELLSRAKQQGYVLRKELNALVDENSDAYEDIVQKLTDDNIDITDAVPLENDGLDEENDIDALDEENVEKYMQKSAPDTEADEISQEYENTLKNKDIDDIVSSIVPPNQSDDPIRMYLREIGQIELLNATQEVSLSSTVQQGLLAQRTLKAIEAGKKKETEEKIKALEKDVEKGYGARDVLIESNLRLVVHIAKRYLGRGMQFQDLIQEGNMGLMKAVNKFDYTKGYKFSTYATWWIKQAITRAIADQARTIRVPVHMVETINKLARTQRRLTQELHREPTPEELAKALGMNVEKVQQIQKIAQEPVSLETPVGEDEDSTLGDFVHDDSTINPLEYTINAKYKEAIDEVLATLTPREERVLRLRFGLVESGKSKTLEQIGKEFKVTRERIRQIANNAIKRLQHQNRKAKLSQFR